MVAACVYVWAVQKSSLIIVYDSALYRMASKENYQGLRLFLGVPSTNAIAAIGGAQIQPKDFQKPWKWRANPFRWWNPFGLSSLLCLDPSCCDTDAQRHHAGLIPQKRQGRQKRMVPGSAFRCGVNMTGDGWIGWMRMAISTQCGLATGSSKTQ